MTRTAQLTILVAMIAATIFAGAHAATAQQDPFDEWVTVGECDITVTRSGVLVEVYVDGQLVAALDSPGDTWSAEGPITVTVVGHILRDDIRSRTYEVPACPDITTTSTTISSTTSTTMPDPGTPTTSFPPTTVPEQTTTTTTPPATTPTTWVPESTITSLAPPTTPTYDAPSVVPHCAALEVLLYPGEYTIRIADEVHEGFTVAETHLFVVAAPLPPYEVVIIQDGETIIDAVVTADDIVGWPCDEAAPPAGDDSSTGGDPILPVTGPAEALRFLAFIGLALLAAGAVAVGVGFIGRGEG